jgi:flagellin
MGLSVQTNVAAMNAYRNLSTSNDAMATSLERLSSGYRINRAADDAAGLAISEGLRSQIGGLTQAVRNTQDGISVVQTAEGALDETTSILQRMRDLAVQASNGGALNSAAKDNIQKEVLQLQSELTRISDTTNFNGTKLLQGDYAGSFQVGADAGQTIEVTIGDMSATGLAVDTVDVGSTGDPSGAITAIDDAIALVSAQRADLGAFQNRFDHTINNLNVAIENTTASESRIRDTDMASEMTSYTSNQVLVQAGTAMLSQANSSTQSILKLLQG